MSTIKKRATSTKATLLRQQCLALTIAISKGVIVKANIAGIYRQLISIKCGTASGITLLFHDEQEHLCLFKVAPETEAMEFLVYLRVPESEAGNV